MTSKRSAKWNTENDYRYVGSRTCQIELRELCAAAITALFLCLGAGGIREAIAQNNINIENHLNHARELSMKAIAKEKKIYNRIRQLDVLILEGDSWFNLPLHSDISDELEELGYAIMSGAHPGDTLENMAFGGQLNEMAGQLRRLFDYRKSPKAIVLSVGGNDIVGPNLEFLLNHSQSTAFGQGGTDRWQREMLDSALKRIQSYLLDYISAISKMCVTLYHTGEFRSIDIDCGNIPIIVHGYDYPIPSGDGYKFLWFFTLKGPWLRPSFQRKMHSDWDPQGTLMHFIDRHNENLKETVNALDPVLRNPVCYLDLRGEVQGWSDELHPDEAGMRQIAKKLCIAIESGCSAASRPAAQCRRSTE